MKKIKQAICVLLALACLVLPLTGCSSEKGDVFEVKVSGGSGEKTYSVSYELYQTVFLYLRGRVSDVIEDSEGNRVLATNLEKTKAIKEVAEDILMEYYSLVALGEEYGIAITEEDRAAFEAETRGKLQELVNGIDDAEFDYKGTKEEYAEKLYENSMRLAGTTPEYYEFSHYQSLLESRLKAAIGGDLTDYLNQSYSHFKQVIVVYAKGDAAAEAKAQESIDAAREALLSGTEMDAVIKEYGAEDHQTEYYFDSQGYIVGSSSGDSLGAIVINAVKALDENEYSDIISGDEDDKFAYFAIYQRLGFDQEFVCSDYAEAEKMYEYPSVNAGYYTPHYSRYMLLLDSYRQNMALTPYDMKAYNKINVTNID